MAKTFGTWIREVLSKEKVGESENFSAYICEGIENFGLKRVFYFYVESKYRALSIRVETFTRHATNAFQKCFLF